MHYQQIANTNKDIAVRMTTPLSHEILRESISDSQNDCSEIRFLISDASTKIRIFLRGIQKIKKHLHPETVQSIMNEAEYFNRLYDTLDETIWKQQRILRSKDSSDAILNHATIVISQARETIRVNQSLLGAFITSVDWQSPSISHTLASQAGVQEGRIYATINDYKRDQHWNAHEYEELFKSTLIDGFIKIPIHAYATSSGMAAFTTILTYLLFEKKLKGTIVVGKSVYFECKALILQIPDISVIEVDETDTKAILQTIETYAPSVLFFDSLANMPRVPVADLTNIIAYLVSHVKKDTILVVDNTCQSLFFQPFPIVFGKLSKLSLIVFESLNKYHQYGMDRVTGGMVWSYGGDTGKLFDYRDHLGTNIPDGSVASLPTPNKLILARRLKRHGRNTQLIADRLSAYIMSHQKVKFISAAYPGLPSHPSYAWTKEYAFNGSYITLEFAKKYQTVASYKRFIALVLRVAKSKHCNILSGTSFGLNTTRIYLTAVRSTPTTPFVRISIGTEHRMTIELIAEILIQSVADFH